MDSPLFPDVNFAPMEPVPAGGEKLLTTPLTLPTGARYLVDSNELTDQHNGYKLENAIVRKLTAGDYSVELAGGRSLEADVVVERKAFHDMLGCVTSGRGRWERALDKLREVRYPSVVLEFSVGSVAHGKFKHTRVSPQSVLGSMVAWSQRLRIPFWFAGSAVQGEEITKWLLCRGAADVLAEG